MARTTWQVSKMVNGSWVLSSDVFYVPNDDMEINTTSNASTGKLANGAQYVVCPEVKYNDEPITMTFLAIPEGDAFKTLIEGYSKANTYIKLVDSLGGVMTGFFSSVQRVWLSGEDNTYDIQAVFTRH
jgi:hypothetical protein